MKSAREATDVMAMSSIALPLDKLRVKSPLYNATLVLDLPDTGPDDRVDATIAAMKAIVKSTDVTQRVAKLARVLVAHEGYRDYGGMLRAVFELLSPVERGGRVQFARDIAGRELLRHPDQLIDEMARAGVTSADCDDRAMLGAALCRAMGFRAGFIVVGKRAKGPFHHVMFCAQHKGRAVPMDPQETRAPGRFPGHARKKIYWID